MPGKGFGVGVAKAKVRGGGSKEIEVQRVMGDQMVFGVRKSNEARATCWPE